MKPFLIDGKIPPYTECKWKEQCDPKNEFCEHKGKSHAVPFSCAFARAYELLEKRK